MRRWNGWGDDGEDAELSGGMGRFLERLIGPGTPPRDASLADVVASVPAARLPDDPRLDRDAEARVRHARGQSLPDLVDLRSGRLEAVPDAVARPRDADEVRGLLELATATGAVVVPYGGGTSVVGGVSVRPSERPVLTIDLGGLSGVRAFDERSGLATVGAGTTGPELDTALAARGWTVGHEPQSWELATVGGWVAARGSGLRSVGAGRIEALFAGGRFEAPAGRLDLPPHPASAAGPDLRQVVLGSEGRFGILTDAILRATPAPDVDVLEGFALPGWEAGIEAARELAQARPGLASVRLSTPTETATLLALADRPGQTRALGAYLRLRGLPADWALLLVGTAGRRRVAAAARRETRAIIGRRGGVRVPAVADSWRRSRFRSPYLRNRLWDAGYAADTLETATTWTGIPELAASVARALRHGLEAATARERVHVFSHLSHVYPSGSSLYVTYLFRLGRTPDETLDRWRTLKGAASAAIVAAGGTISHHHGVGVDHAPYLAAEKGPLGMTALENLARTFDPAGIMNPGVLLPVATAGWAPADAAAEAGPRAGSEPGATVPTRGRRARSR